MQIFNDVISPIRFYELTHLDFETFCILTNWLKDCPDKRKPESRLYKWEQSRRKTSTPFDCAVLCGVLYLTGSGTLRVKSFMLHMSTSSYDSLAQYVVEELVARSHEVIFFPSKENQVFMYSSIVKRPFEGALFALDGTLINLLYKGKDNTYYSRKGGPQINVQIMCDYKKHFVYVDSNYSGRTFDNTAFTNSPAWDLIHNKGILREGGFVIADEGYALNGKILRPYQKDERDPERVLFREIFKSARLHVENAIGMFKRRCPWLYNGMHAASPEKMTSTVFAAAVLHQFALFCEEHLNHIPKDYLNQPFEIPTEFLGKSGYELRKAVTKFLKKSYPLMFRSIVNGEYNPKYV